MKLNYRFYRYRKALKKGHESFNTYGKEYSNPIIFIAGLPKSGTTWLENMLSGYPGFTIIPDPQITKWDYQHNGTHRFELSMDYFEKIKDTLTIVKVHCHGSTNNTMILKKLNIPYCIMYRDLRDAAVSYVFYVKRTPWHPEYRVYKKMDIQSGLKYFGSTLLSEWRDWVLGWKKHYDKDNGIIVKYEEMKAEPVITFGKIVKHFSLPKDDIEKIVSKHQFEKMNTAGSFFRKGKIGDWKNYFDDEIKDIFKYEISDFLIFEGYERRSNW